jgi:hypothetical protein
MQDTCPPAQGFNAGQHQKEETMRRVLVLVSAVVAVGFAAFAGTASASAPTTPNGYAGAWNMLNDPTMVPVDNDADGPMDVDNYHGNIGMCGAGLASSGVGC